MSGIQSALPDSIYSIGSQVFSRAGSYLGVAARPARHAKPRDIGRRGTAELCLVSGRGGAAGQSPTLMKLFPTRGGVRLPYALSASATELTLSTDYGSVRLCFAEPELLLIRGENGLGLLLEANFGIHQTLRRRGARSWESPHSGCCCLVYTALSGELRMDAPYDMDTLSTPRVRGALAPDADGAFLLAVEEFRAFGYVRAAYPSYEEGLRSAAADWEACLAAMPAAPAFAAGRERAAYQIWSMLTAPSGRAPRRQIWRTFGRTANTFEGCLCAAACGGDLPLAIELLRSQLDQQSPNGQLPVFCDDMRGLFQSVVPPAQGWALECLMRGHDLAAEVPEAQRLALYEGLSRYVAWFDACRDADGLPCYEGGDECGLEGSPVFSAQMRVLLPDLSAFLALLEEKLGDLAGMSGRGAEAASWYARSRARIRRMLDAFWNGRRFVGRVPGSGEVVETESLLFYRPLILGKRLPQAVLRAMAEDLSEGNGFLTPAGFLSQRMTSREFSRLRPGAGRIVPMENALVISGLRDAGLTAEAQRAAERFCGALLRPVSPVWPAEHGFTGSVTAAAFQLLAAAADASSQTM